MCPHAQFVIHNCKFAVLDPTCPAASISGNSQAILRADPRPRPINNHNARVCADNQPVSWFRLRSPQGRVGQGKWGQGGKGVIGNFSCRSQHGQGRSSGGGCPPTREEIPGKGLSSFSCAEECLRIGFSSLSAACLFLTDFSILVLFSFFGGISKIVVSEPLVSIVGHPTSSCSFSAKNQPNW